MPASQKDIRVLIPGTCEYINLYGKKNFTDMSKLRILQGEINLSYLGEPT